jgi:retron-type reverse transcriptase
VDISKFFDTLDHGHLRQFVQHRVLDGVLLRLIGKWLNAGVMEAGQLSYPESGSPQGGVISPSSRSEDKGTLSEDKGPLNILHLRYLVSVPLSAPPIRYFRVR